MEVTLLKNTLLHNERHRATEKVDVESELVPRLIEGGFIESQDWSEIGPSTKPEPEPEPEPDPGGQEGDGETAAAPQVAKAKRTTRKKVTE